MGTIRSSLNKLWKQLLVFVALMLVAVGCHSPGRGRIVSQAAPLDESARSSFGRTGLLLSRHDAGFGFAYPMNKAHAVGNAAAKTWDTLYDDTDPGLDGFLFGLVVSGVSGVIGGMATGVPQSEIDAAEKQLASVLKENPLLPGISNRLQFVLQKRGLGPLVEVPPLLADELNSVFPDDRNYLPLSAIGIDTLIEVRVDQHSFAAKEHANPRMTAEAKARVEIRSVPDGTLLFSGPIHYRGHQYRFREWAADDAKKFRSELKCTERVIGRTIADQVSAPVRADLN